MDFWAAFAAGSRRLVGHALRVTVVSAVVLGVVGYAIGGGQGVRNGAVWSLVIGAFAFVGMLTAVVVDVQEREGPLFALDDWNHEG